MSMILLLTIIHTTRRSTNCMTPHMSNYSTKAYPKIRKTTGLCYLLPLPSAACQTYNQNGYYVSGAWAERKTKRSDPKNRVERSGAVSGRGSKNDRAERSAERERSLTARSNVIFHWFHKFIITLFYIARTLYCIHFYRQFFKHAQPNETQSMSSSTWRGLATWHVHFER